MKLRAIALLAVLCLLFSTAAFADEPQPYLNGSVFVDASDGVEVQLTRVRIANKITVRVAVETEDDTCCAELRFTTRTASLCRLRL